MAKMWAGRFKKDANAKLDSFNTSLPFDCRLYKQDIQGSLVHSKMLEKQGILSKKDVDLIQEGLYSILNQIESHEIEFTKAEDIHMFIEEKLTNEIGDAGKRLHTARSRNDQVALDMRLYVKEEIIEIQKLLFQLLDSLCVAAKSHLKTYMPGYTHLQRAQPITFAHWCMAYANMFKRDIIRLKNTYSLMNECPLGCAALATTTYPIDREYTSSHLGFYKPIDNSLDGVSDRDYCVELCSDLSLIMVHLSRMSEEIIQWCSLEFHFVELDDAFSTGSSIMPQKKNPDICELIRGKSGRTIGDLNTLLVMLKGLPLAYNKDMQEDKEAVFDCIDTVKECLDVFIPMFQTMKICKDNMMHACLHGFINATDLADYLTKKGLPFRDAYHIVGQIVGYGIENKKSLNEISLEEYKKFHASFEEDVYQYIDIETCVNNRNVLGGPSPDSVSVQIQKIEDFMKQEASYE